MAMALLGLLAGVLTTVAGMGGGVVMILALSALIGPLEALAVSGPALLVGNLHRAFIFRRSIDLPSARAFALGAVPGGLLGGLAAALIPPLVLQALMLIGVGTSVARALGWVRFDVPKKALVPASAGIGVLTATSGGASGLVGGLFLSMGYKGERYVATTSVCAVALHAARIAAYGVAGVMTTALVVQSAWLAATITLGNLLGLWLRKRLSVRVTEHAELAALVVAAALAIGGPFLPK